MNEIEKRILMNQVSIMRCLRRNLNTEWGKEQLDIDLQATSDLLNPPKEQTIAERTHDALSQKTEVKKNE